MKWVLIFVIGVALFVAYSCMLWRDGYNDGMLKERRDKIRSWTHYNAAIRNLEMELNLVRADLRDIHKNLAADTEPDMATIYANDVPLIFSHQHSDEPIGRVVNTEERDGGLLFHIKAETDEYMATEFGEEDTSVIAETVKPELDIAVESLTPVQKEAFDSLCS